MKFGVRCFMVALALVSYAWSAPTGAAEQAEPRAVSCKLIRNVSQLQAMQNNLAGSYCLARDIDAGSVNFVPIGDFANPFTGKFFGNNHVIRNLTINSAERLVGLFGRTGDAVIQDVGLVNVNIVGTSDNNGWVGALAASNGVDDGTTVTISRVYVTGRVECTGTGCAVGGISGDINHDTILTDSWSSARVVGTTHFTGGAVAYVGIDATLIRTYATGQVSCGEGCISGGLVGLINGTVRLSYGSGPVFGGMSSSVGGLAGKQDGGASSTRQSYGAGAVKGGDQSTVGGLIGTLVNATIAQAYAVGWVRGGALSSIGGLIRRWQRSCWRKRSISSCRSANWTRHNMGPHRPMPMARRSPPSIPWSPAASG